MLRYTSAMLSGKLLAGGHGQAIENRYSNLAYAPLDLSSISFSCKSVAAAVAPKSPGPVNCVKHSYQRLFTRFASKSNCNKSDQIANHPDICPRVLMHIAFVCREYWSEDALNILLTHTYIYQDTPDDCDVTNRRPDIKWQD